MMQEPDISKKILEEAKEKADWIVKDAKEYRRQIQGASLEYVDDMLTEVSLIAKRAKESIRIIFEQAIDEFDQKIDMIAENQKDLLKDLRELTENGERPIRKVDYEIRIDEEFSKKQAYELRIRNSKEETKEVHKPYKQSYEIKIADEWKEKIERMDEDPLPKAPEPTPEPEPEEGFKASDFNLDEEYFEWLNEKEEKGW